MERMFRFKPQEHRIPGTKVNTGNVLGATSKPNEAAFQGQRRVTLSPSNSQSAETASLWRVTE